MRRTRPDTLQQACRQRTKPWSRPGLLLTLSLALLGGCLRGGYERVEPDGAREIPAVPSPGSYFHDLSFIGNRGQWHPDVRYMSMGGGMRAWFTDEEIVYDLSGRNGGHVLRHRFIDAEQPTVDGVAPTAAKRSYIRGGETPVNDVTAYDELRYRRLYPGVDARFLRDEGALKYDLIVAPGADPARIRYRYEGAEGIAIDRDGALIVRTSVGTLREEAPFCYQEGGRGREPVECRFTITDDVIGFDLGAYDRSRALVIDPKLVYSSYLGGDSTDANDAGQGITVDGGGNIYVTGTTQSYAFPVTQGAYQRKLDSINGSVDLFVTIFDPTGSTLLFGTYIGGRGRDEASAIRVSGDGRIIVAGWTTSTDFPTTATAIDRNLSGGEDGFVLWLQGSTLSYSTYLGGTGVDRIQDVTVTGGGDAIAVGWTASTDYPITTGSFDGTPNGGEDVVVTRLNPAAGLVYSTYLGGAANERATGVASHPSGAAYLTGWTTSSNFPTSSGAFQTTNNGGTDGFIARIRLNGAVLDYSTYIGGSGQDLPNDIAVDAADAVYITGSTTSSDYPVTFPDAFGSWFVTKLTGSSLGYSRYIGASDGGRGTTIQVDENSRAYLAGVTSGSGFPIIGATAAPGGGLDIGFLHLAADGTAQLATVVGGSGDDIPWTQSSITRYGDLYVTGVTNSTNLPRIVGAFDSTLNRSGGAGRTDAFIMRFNFQRRPSIYAPLSITFDTLRCDGVEQRETFFVHNNGDSDLVIWYNKFELATGRFRLESPDSTLTSIVIRPGERRQYVVRFLTERPGDSREILRIENNDSIRNPIRVVLNGVRVAPFLQGPRNVIFDTTAVCQPGGSDTTIVINNGGNERSRVTMPQFKLGAASPFSIVSPSFPVTIDTNSAMPLRLNFTPRRAGLVRDTLTFVDQCGSPRQIALEGYADSVALTSSVDRLQFATVVSCGAGKEEREIVLTNSGTDTVRLDNVTVTGKGFTLVGSAPRTLAPGTLRLRVRFEPIETGKFTGTFRVAASPCNIVIDVALEGERQGGGGVELGATAVDFGVLAVCEGEEDSADASVVVINRWPGAITLPAPDLDDPFIIINRSEFGAPIPSGSPFFMRLRYRPRTVGTHRDTIVIPYMAGECHDTIRVPLSGMRDLPVIEPTDTLVEFADLSECEESAETVVTLRNRSLQPITIRSFDASSGARVLSPVLQDFTIDPGTSADVRIEFMPRQPGLNEDTITLRGIPCRDSLVIRLRGRKLGAVLAFSETDLVIPTLLDCALPATIDTAVTLRSLGSGTFRVASITATPPFTLTEDLTGTELVNDDELRIPIRLDATALGTFTGTLAIRMEPCGDLLELPLSASVVHGELTVIDGGSFGVVTAGSRKTGQVRLVNPLPRPVRVSDVADIVAPFRLLGTSPGIPTTLAPGDTLIVDVEFAPTASGTYQPTAVVLVDDPCAFGTSFSLNGEGFAPQETIELCLSGRTGGLVGDTVELAVTSSLSGALSVASDLHYLIHYDWRRLVLLDVNGAGVAVLDSGIGTGRLDAVERELATIGAQPLRLRFRLLAGESEKAIVRLDSAAFDRPEILASLCADSATVDISGGCIVTTVKLGRYANMLDAPVPNPASGAIELTYQQLEDARARLRIYDMTGREVLRPLDGEMRGGRYTLRIDVSTLPAGTYLYQIEAGSYRETKMLVIGR